MRLHTSETQCGKILLAMQQDPGVEWFVKDFTKNPHFIWYEAGTRIGDLVREWLIYSFPDEDNRKYSVYCLTKAGSDYKVEMVEPVRKTFISRVTEVFL